MTILLAAMVDVIVGSFMPPDVKKQAYGITGWDSE